MLREEGGSGIYRVCPDGSGRGSEEPPCELAGGGGDGLFREVSRRSDVDRQGEDSRGDYVPPAGTTYNGLFL
ncbi:hypothetical protein CO172_03610 [Candidatus Uhrbacteria bacterium CG_4_9_14_3_um_filter_36_7]|uniref:Uncharacterized protein n=1 Tax=Candidatus Uhrbacteria bacterium CG_4_9_14_3_um_filter_36_7 TaxID=1975033 RepID=A0A2M7XFT9_9BACT|nr:MAG: hypothetical protein CO172_03610 [Candidatus Uhrbacteria bacterium CG_4_9_14_3_um_filter_36_7]